MSLFDSVVRLSYAPFGAGGPSLGNTFILLELLTGRCLMLADASAFPMRDLESVLIDITRVLVDNAISNMSLRCECDFMTVVSRGRETNKFREHPIPQAVAEAFFISGVKSKRRSRCSSIVIERTSSNVDIWKCIKINMFLL